MKTGKFNLFSIGIIIFAITTFGSCKKEKDDEDILPAATCSDGIKNQGEAGVDCGGPCEACLSAGAKLNGTNWTAAIITATNSGADFSLAGATPDGKGFAFTVSANSAIGSYGIITGKGAFQTSSATADQYATNVTGSATISRFDTGSRKVSGVFSYTATTIGGNPGAITEGVFTNVRY